MCVQPAGCYVDKILFHHDGQIELEDHQHFGRLQRLRLVGLLQILRHGALMYHQLECHHDDQ